MAVEVYIDTEIEQLVTDDEETTKWKELVDSIGAAGQKELVNSPATNSGPIPFQPMNQSMLRVYTELCPRHFTLENYNTRPIPVRVLEVIKLCQERGYFAKIQIWDDSNSPDPIVVGLDSDKWSANQFLIARWGDELRSFVELKKIASARYLERRKNILKAMLNNVEQDVPMFMNGEKNLYEPNY